jgi:hypothetical protein
VSDLLSLAIKAKIPMVRVTTEDPINAVDILKHLSGKTPLKWSGSWGKHIGGLVYAFSGDTKPAIGVPLTQASYNAALEKEVTIVLINAEDGVFETVLDCGPLLPPHDYIEEQLSGLMSAPQATKFSRYFLGMEFNRVIETVMLTQARDKTLSVAGINETKAYLGHGLSGLDAIDTKMGAYLAPEWAEKWLLTEAPLLKDTKLKELWPKGFMLSGPPGTGKTELARYIASRMGYPLFRLDGGSIYSRWQGETEQNLRRILSFISGQGQCVFLVDEADKLFGQKAEGQASNSTLQSMLLWWLQGQSNEAITVMTANNIDVIPPELYRPGRLDAVHGMYGFTLKASIVGFVQMIALSFDHLGVPVNVVVDRVLYQLPEGPVSQATLVSMVRSAVKQILVEGKTNAQEN